MTKREEKMSSVLGIFRISADRNGRKDLRKRLYQKTFTLKRDLVYQFDIHRGNAHIEKIVQEREYPSFTKLVKSFDRMKSL